MILCLQSEGQIREEDLKRLLKRYMYKYRFVVSVFFIKDILTNLININN